MVQASEKDLRRPFTTIQLCDRHRLRARIQSTQCSTVLSRVFSHPVVSKNSPPCTCGSRPVKETGLVYLGSRYSTSARRQPSSQASIASICFVKMAQACI